MQGHPRSTFTAICLTAMATLTVAQGAARAGSPAENILKRIAAADSVQVFQLRQSRSARSEPVAHNVYRIPLLMMRRAEVDTAWRHQAVRALSSLVRFESARGCLSPCDTCLDERLVGMRFFGRKHPLEVLVSAHDRDAEFQSEDGALAHARFGQEGDALVDLVRRTFPPDSSLASGERAPARDSTRPIGMFGEFEYDEKFPEAVTHVRPVYSADLARTGVTGKVVVEALVGRDGLVRDAKVLSSIPALDNAVLQAVRQWTFKPARCNCELRPVWVAIPFSFHP